MFGIILLIQNISYHRVKIWISWITNREHGTISNDLDIIFTTLPHNCRNWLRHCALYSNAVTTTQRDVWGIESMYENCLFDRHLWVTIPREKSNTCTVVTNSFFLYLRFITHPRAHKHSATQPIYHSSFLDTSFFHIHKLSATWISIYYQSNVP